MFGVKQQFVDLHMRMMLLEWMMEFSDEFLFKRQTFALAVSYIDLYLTK
jgi:hypothetical protein